MGVLYSELAAVYNALRARAPAPALAALPIQYPDYAAWQRACLQSGELEPQVPCQRRMCAGHLACVRRSNMGPAIATPSSAETAGTDGW